MCFFFLSMSFILVMQSIVFGSKYYHHVKIYYCFHVQKYNVNKIMNTFTYLCSYDFLHAYDISISSLTWHYFSYMVQMSDTYYEPCIYSSILIISFLKSIL